MRGGRAYTRQELASARVSQQGTGSLLNVPAPLAGWCTNVGLTAGKPNQAIQLINAQPLRDSVIPRQGKRQLNSFGNTFNTFIPYNSGSTSKLFAARSAGFYDVTSAGAPSGPTGTITNGSFSHTNFTTAGGSYVVAVNAVDLLQLYDGATWAGISGATVPAITGVTTSNLSYVTAHKGRLWFVEKNSMKLWYLPTAAVGGAATQFPMGSFFKKGGKIIAIGTWTVDGGAGPDDFFVIVTSEGEIAVYQGTDPASASSWALVGVYAVAKPVTVFPLFSYGGDLLYLGETGLYPISVLLQRTTTDPGNAFTANIRDEFNSAVSANRTSAGWQIAYHPFYDLLIVNAPIGGGSYVQFAMNTYTGAWAKWTGWNTPAMVVYNGSLRFSEATGIYNVYDIAGATWQDHDENGEVVPFSVTIQSYHFTSGHASIVEMIRPYFSYTSETLTITLSIIDDLTGSGQSGTYSTSLPDDPNPWLMAENNPGTYHSFSLSFVAPSTRVAYLKADVVLQASGLL